MESNNLDSISAETQSASILRAWLTLVPANWLPPQQNQSRWGLIHLQPDNLALDPFQGGNWGPWQGAFSAAQLQDQRQLAQQALDTGLLQIKRYTIQTQATHHWEEVRMAPINAQDVLALTYRVEDGVPPRPPAAEDKFSLVNDKLQSLILKSIPDLLVVVRKDGGYIRFLSGGNVNLYLQGQEHQLMNLYSCLPPHLAQQRLEAIHLALTTRTQQDYEYAIEINGKCYYEEARIVPIDGEEALVIIRDISDRKRLEIALREKAKQEHLLNQILSQIGQTLKLQDVFHTAVTQIRDVLTADRVLFYRFEPDWSGVVVAESVADPWRSMLGEHVVEHCLTQPAYIDAYLKGRIHNIPDVQQEHFSDCHQAFLTQWQVQANLLVPIKHDNLLYGLLAAQQCQAPRQWQDWEIGLLKQIAEYFSMAIKQGELYQRLQIANEELERLATTDSLTQVANRLRFDAYLTREWYRMRREQQPLSLVLFDIDSFKQFNDTYGHIEGDNCLKQVAQAAAKALKRPTDFLARYGGEEFAIVLSNTRLSGAYAVAETIRCSIAALQIPHQQSTLSEKIVTASFGIAWMVPTLDDLPNQLVRAADKALYQAKAAGRNCCCPRP